MRLRNALAAALGAAVLVVAMPGSASAATGSLDFKYGDVADPTEWQIQFPNLNECYAVPKVDGAYVDAYAPENRSNADAAMFLDAACEDPGEDGKEVLLHPGDTRGNEYHFRSVRFLLSSG
ncbi:hypothetical protein OG264_33165 [Streptomyces xanthophaeus]|uniref:hypothetical protein n=1 Tax=Streptomyces xanthophaeus TaxID=67385 RepID=UPI00386FE476|nr:hypothetical protein OG264_33165 [Streptomyces xanthophaeus]WST59095.1 hypothetical protein OG605_05275 [Streptomyces xanthophaeus]